MFYSFKSRQKTITTNFSFHFRALYPWFTSYPLLFAPICSSQYSYTRYMQHVLVFEWHSQQTLSAVVWWFRAPNIFEYVCSIEDPFKLVLSNAHNTKPIIAKVFHFIIYLSYHFVHLQSHHLCHLLLISASLACVSCCVVFNFKTINFLIYAFS